MAHKLGSHVQQLILAYKLHACEISACEMPVCGVDLMRDGDDLDAVVDEGDDVGGQPDGCEGVHIE